MTSPSIDLDQALVHPAAVFDTPIAVCETSQLTPTQKIDILRRWDYDLRELQVADAENMTGGTSPAAQLRQVHAALRQVQGVAAEPQPPTRQG